MIFLFAVFLLRFACRRRKLFYVPVALLLNTTAAAFHTDSIQLCLSHHVEEVDTEVVVAAVVAVAVDSVAVVAVVAVDLEVAVDTMKDHQIASKVRPFPLDVFPQLGNFKVTLDGFPQPRES